MRPPDQLGPHHAPTGLVRLIDLAEADTALIEGWLRAAHVRRWWGDPDENLARLGTPVVGSRRAIIEADSRKVGLVLWSHPPREELDQAGLHDISTDVIDIDIMIGEPDAVGRGIGAAAIRLVVADVFANTSAPYLIAATMTGNVASRKAFENAGFSVDREFDDPPYGRCILMLCRRGPGCGRMPSA
jgi:aminoglycoside 6'-N-acetyltransferase